MREREKALERGALCRGRRHLVCRWGYRTGQFIRASDSEGATGRPLRMSRDSGAEKGEPTPGPLREKAGAQGRIRTTDTRIFSPLLYQLSYLGFFSHPRRGPNRGRRARPWLIENPPSPVERCEGLASVSILGLVVASHRLSRDHIFPSKPARKIDIGARLAAERPVGLDGRFTAERALRTPLALRPLGLRLGLRSLASLHSVSISARFGQKNVTG